MLMSPGVGNGAGLADTGLLSRFQLKLPKCWATLLDSLSGCRDWAPFNQFTKRSLSGAQPSREMTRVRGLARSS